MANWLNFYSERKAELVGEIILNVNFSSAKCIERSLNYYEMPIGVCTNGCNSCGDSGEKERLKSYLINSKFAKVRDDSIILKRGLYIFVDPPYVV